MNPPAFQPTAIAQRLSDVCRHYRLLALAIAALCLMAGAMPGMLPMADGVSGVPGTQALYTLAALSAIVALACAAPDIDAGRVRRSPADAQLPAGAAPLSRSSHGAGRDWV